MSESKMNVNESDEEKKEPIPCQLTRSVTRRPTAFTNSPILSGSIVNVAACLNVIPAFLKGFSKHRKLRFL